jgi:antibiotic biosynthesis monooxygenase (ABM) superfamily enzyme
MLVVASTSSTPPQQAHATAPPAMPPRWKTAVVVWLAIYPSITFVLWLAGPKIQGWPLAVRTLAITAVVVPLMVFVLLPGLQRLLAPWLRRQAGRAVSSELSAPPPPQQMG